MIEYANESVIKLLKQYDMFSKSLKYTSDLKQKNDICDEMTKIIQSVLEITNAIYEEKFKKVEKRSVYLMSEERTRLLELINLINERRAYVNNQVVSNKELTGIGIDVQTILGEEKLEEYKQQVKIIERYKNNIKLEGILKEEIKSLDSSIKKANDKIKNNENLNSQLEERMTHLLENAFKKLSLYELKERKKEIDLAYTELGYSLEKAKENAKIARRDCSEEIILECDNMLASITLEYERYKEKKLILSLIDIYKRPVSNYQEILNKREEMNNILINITSSDLYAMVGTELNKEYATIKLEQQDVATLKSLVEEKDIKSSNLEDIIEENNSKELKGLLANLLENEKKYQEKLLQEKQKQEQERLEQERLEEEKRQKEIARRQQALEEERKKEIERRTKELLVEKKNPILNSTRENIHEEHAKEVFSSTKKNAEPMNSSRETKRKSLPSGTTRASSSRAASTYSMSNSQENDKSKINELRPKRSETSKNIAEKTIQPRQKTEDFFSAPSQKKNVIDEGIPVIRNKNLDNQVVTSKKAAEEKKVFPDIPLEKKENIFPSFPEINKTNSFFDEDEFKDLSNYMEDNKKNSWF
ncbi:MAG: hypothetical protein PUD25_01140 [Bacilli bacterium]|nr:hypothetical protein [Bacilli bacterium]